MSEIRIYTNTKHEAHLLQSYLVRYNPLVIQGNGSIYVAVPTDSYGDRQSISDEITRSINGHGIYVSKGWVEGDAYAYMAKDTVFSYKYDIGDKVYFTYDGFIQHGEIRRLETLKDGGRCYVYCYVVDSCNRGLLVSQNKCFKDKEELKEIK